MLIMPEFSKFLYPYLCLRIDQALIPLLGNVLHKTKNLLAHNQDHMREVQATDNRRSNNERTLVCRTSGILSMPSVGVDVRRSPQLDLSNREEMY